MNIVLEVILNIAAHDKKRSGSDLSVVWVEEIGSCEIKKMPLEDWKTMIRKNLDATEA